MLSLDFTVMSDAAASALLGILTVIAFAVAVETGRVARISPKYSTRARPGRMPMALSNLGYLLLFAFVAAELLAVLNGAGKPSLAWAAAGGLFAVDAAVLAFLASFRDRD